MTHARISNADLRGLAAEVAERRGWNFSQMNSSVDAVPWVYDDVVRSVLFPAAEVLDIGTGGGERFRSFAPFFARGVGIDDDHGMVRIAGEDTPPHLAGTLEFKEMSAVLLEFPNATFDIVLNRHAPISPIEVTRVLRPGGMCITQQVGTNNTQNLYEALGWESNGAYIRASSGGGSDPARPGWELAGAAREFERCGAEVVRAETYDVPYYFTNVRSFVFWLKSVPIPMTFDDDAIVTAVAEFISANTTARGIKTNEQRDLLVVHKG